MQKILFEHRRLVYEIVFFDRLDTDDEFILWAHEQKNIYQYKKNNTSTLNSKSNEGLSWTWTCEQVT
jgi:hypothetical protein